MEQSTQGKTLLVLGAGEWQVPTIRKAKELGWRVLATDGVAERPGFAIADIHEVADIANPEAILSVAKRWNIDGIICDTTDVAVFTMSYVAEALSLTGIGTEVARNFTSKARMRDVLQSNGLNSPPYRRVSNSKEALSALQSLGSPAVMKPVSSQSSRGVTILSSANQVTDAYAAARAASKTGEVLIEGFLEGTELTVEGYCVDGKPTIIAISDKDHLSNLPAVAHRLTYPALLTDEQRDAVHYQNDMVIRALGLQTGIFHAEYMIQGSNVTLVEVAARGGGSYVYTEIAKRLANFDLSETYMRFLMGEGWKQGPKLAPELSRPKAANLAFFAFPEGLVTGIRGLEEARSLPGVAQLLIEIKIGARILSAADDRSRHGLVLCFGQSRESVLYTAARVYDLVELQIDGMWQKGDPENAG